MKSPYWQTDLGSPVKQEGKTNKQIHKNSHIPTEKQKTKYQLRNELYK